MYMNESHNHQLVKLRNCNAGPVCRGIYENNNKNNEPHKQQAYRNFQYIFAPQLMMLGSKQYIVCNYNITTCADSCQYQYISTHHPQG